MLLFRPHLTLALCLAGIIASGCGQKRQSSDQPVQRLVYSQKKPFDYILADPECQKKTEPVRIAEAAIWGWDEQFSVVESMQDLFQTTSYRSVESRYVTGTSYNNIYSRDCPSPSKGEELCVPSNAPGPISFTTSVENHPLRICKSGERYPRDTIETAAITTLHYINDAGRAYEDNTGKKIPRLHLEVMPRFETTEVGALDENGETVNVRSYITDNLAYFPSIQSIMVLPQSQIAHDRGANRFYESAWVDGHEFGHHIEEVLFGSDLRATGLYWQPFLHSYVTSDDRDGDDSSSSFEFKSRTRVGLRTRLWTAFSESFADLISYYSQKEVSTSLEQLECIGGNRRIDSAVFGDGMTKKLLNSERINELLYGTRKTSRCDSLEFSDPHIAGAVVAHTLDVVLNIAVRGSYEGSEKFRMKYRWTIDWFSQLVAGLKRDSMSGNDAQRTFAINVAAIEFVFKELPADKKREICETHSELITMVAPPFESSCDKKRNSTR